MKKKRIPEWRDVEGSRRQAQLTALGSITSLTQALVELITNVDDAEPNELHGKMKVFINGCWVGITNEPKEFYHNIQMPLL